MTATGRLDRVAQGTIEGWAWDPERPDRRLEVFAWVDGAFHARALANQTRADLTGLGTGDGRYGFAIPGVRRDAALSIRVAFADGTDLAGSPCRTEAAAVALRTDPGEAVTILAIARDAAPDIAEWIAYHRAIGVGHFRIYDDSRDGTGQRLRENPVLDGIVEVIDWPASADPAAEGRGGSASAHAIPALRRRGGWVAMLDVDQFLVPLVDDDLGGLLRRFADVPALAIATKVFGGSGLARGDDALRIDRCRFAEPGEQETVIVRAEMLEVIAGHPRRTDAGDLRARATSGFAQVNRYPAGAGTEWLVGQTRARYEALEYDLSIQRFVPRLRAAMKDLFGTGTPRGGDGPQSPSAASRPGPVRLAFDPMPPAAGIAHGNIEAPAAVSRTIRIAPGATTRLAGWVFDPARDGTGRRFLLFQSTDRTQAADHALELPERRPRPDVAAHHHQLPRHRTLDCGFDVVADLRQLPRGRYGVGLGVAGADGIAWTGQRWLLDLE